MNIYNIENNIINNSFINKYPDINFYNKQKIIQEEYKNILNETIIEHINIYYERNEIIENNEIKKIKENLNYKGGSEEFIKYINNKLIELYNKIEPLQYDIIGYIGINNNIIGQELYTGKCIKSRLSNNECNPVKFFKDYKEKPEEYIYQKIGFNKFSTLINSSIVDAYNENLEIDTLITLKIPAGTKILLNINSYININLKYKYYLDNNRNTFYLFPFDTIYVLYTEVYNNKFNIPIYIGSICSNINKIGIIKKLIENNLLNMEKYPLLYISTDKCDIFSTDCYNKLCNPNDGSCIEKNNKSKKIIYDWWLNLKNNIEKDKECIKEDTLYDNINKKCIEKNGYFYTNIQNKILKNIPNIIYNKKYLQKFKFEKYIKLYNKKIYIRKINSNTEISKLKISNKINNYKLNQFELIKKHLNHNKSELDKYNSKNNKNYYFINNNRDLYKNLRKNISKNYNGQIITNAWLKCYEIIEYFNLIKPNKNNEINVFCNAELPGGFISAINHYIKTKYSNSKFNWKASSINPNLNFYDNDEKMKNHLQDTYGLWINNKNNWLMSVDNTNEYKNDGDVRKLSNIVDFENKLNNFADLYTHDLGIDVSQDYNKQEEQNIHAHLGASLSGFLTLKKGGNFIGKQYTFFEPISINLIIIYSYLFEEFYICKPLTSRPSNSEIYLIGKNFLGIPSNIKEILLERLNNFNFNPFIDPNLLPLDIINDIFITCFEIYKQQINYIQEDIYFYNFYKDNPRLLFLQLQYLINSIENNWININNLLPLNKKDYLLSSKN